jgi:hypothetical protein
MGNWSFYTITGYVLTLTGVMSRLKEGLGMLAVVDLLLGGMIPTSNSFFRWMDA